MAVIPLHTLMAGSEVQMDVSKESQNSCLFRTVGRRPALLVSRDPPEDVRAKRPWQVTP